MLDVFQIERDDGIADLIAKGNSFAYCSEVRRSSKNLHPLLSEYTAKASLNDSDLYTTESILVSTGFNLNDEFFDKLEVWLARNTANHKPTNLDHDTTQIVGHIFNIYAIDLEGEIIPDNIALDALPDDFHLVDESVTYRYDLNPNIVENHEVLSKMISSLISEIESNKRFVSMECIFRGFDYAIQEEDGSVSIIQRNKETAFLSKYLRAYGGSGKYEGKRIGRVPRRITFSGKGFVTRPANPDSIIFPPVSKKISIVASEGVLDTSMLTNNSTENKMSQELETQITELKAKVLALTTENTSLKDSSKQAAIAKIESEKTELQSALDQAKTELATEVSAKAALEAEIAKLTKEIADSKTSQDAIKAELETAKSELNTIKETAVKTKRINQFVTAGVSKDEAVKLVDKFISLDDESFDIIASLAKPSVQENKEEEKPVEQILEETKADVKPNLSASDDEVAAKAEVARASIRDMIKQTVGNKNNK